MHLAFFFFSAMLFLGAFAVGTGKLLGWARLRRFREYLNEEHVPDHAPPPAVLTPDLFRPLDED